MNKKTLFKKAVAWSLIASMINPATFGPAFARDSDIYLFTPSGTSTAEPNILFILGTNDRMNVAEAWREYDPLVYDSHAEYLWNDINIISPAEVLTENANAISDAAPPVNPFSPWGTWSGALNTDRRALWQATLAYANGTQPGDPGPRTTYRNYWLGSWYYWAPTGTATTDPKLWSVSFNRFLGFVQTVPGARGGVTFPATTANYNGANDFRSSNACTASLTQLEPSTIFAPTGRAQNAGYMLNQQWVRWEQYLGLAAINNPALNYPGNNTTANGATANTSSNPSVTTFLRGYVDGVSGAPTNTVGAEPTNVYRDSNGGNIGSQGLPIRRQRGPLAALPAVTNPTNTPDGVRSYAGWTDPKADMGGFVFWSWTATSTAGYYYPQTVLAALRGVYGYGLGAAGLAAVPAGTLANEQFAAWLGNRDGAPAFGSMVGVPGYYDTTVTSCNPASGPSVANKCIQFSSGASTYQIQQSCTPMGAVRKEIDASGTTRFTQAAGACNPTGSASCYVNGVLQGSLAPCTAVGTTTPICNLLTDPNFFTTAIAANCGYTGGTVVNVGTCQWTGRQSVYIEGQGTYFYGGTCGESGYNSTSPNSSCAVGGGGLAPGVYNASKVLNGVAQTDVIGPYPSPAPGTGPTTLGCVNTVAAGSYRYGGTCSGGQVYQMPTFNNSQTPGSLPVPPVPSATPGGPPAARQLIGSASNPVGSRAAVCAAPSGGTSLNIRNMGAQTYNRTCNNNYSNVNSCLGWYGTQCQPFSTPSANCQTPVTNTVTAGATGQWYQAYQLQATGPTGFVHECLADSAANNGAANTYPTSYMRVFGTAYNAASTPNATTGITQAYTTGGGAQQYTVDATKNIDVYSTNYLNFLYGAKACRDSAGNLLTTGPISTPPAGATCSPIARKTRLQVAKDALSALVATTNSVRLGLMVYNKTDTTTADEGGNIVYAIRRMGDSASDTPAYNNRASLISAIQGVTASSRTPLTETMYEAYRYFSGRTPVFGTLATAAQVGGAVSAGRETTVGTNIDPVNPYGNTFVINNVTGKYNSPMMNNPNVAAPANCQQNYIVMITNGQPEEDYSANAAIKTMAYASATGATVSPRTDFDTNGSTPNNAGAPDYRQIPTVAGGVAPPYGPTDAAGTVNDGGYVWLDELSYFLSSADVSPGAANYQSEYSNCASPSGTHICDTPTTTDLISGRQSVITYTIGFAGVSAPVVQNAANVAGGTFYIAQNAQQLQAALTATFTSIVSYDATTAAVTVPISSLNRGVNSTDIYLAFFAPSVSSTWAGTVKKFQLSVLDTDCGVGFAPCLIGQTQVNGTYNIETRDPITGQGVVDPAVTSGPNDLQHPPGSAWYASTVQDGSKPNKGGTGHVLINTAGYTPDVRPIYTYLTDSVPNQNSVSTSLSLTAATNAVHLNNAAKITACRLGDTAQCSGAGTMTAATQETLINYIRGGNLGDANCTDGSTGTACTTWSSWPHAGVEHSKPLVITYDGTDPINGQYMFYLQTNGMLSVVNTHTGKEVWAFLVEEALPKLQAMQANANGPEIYGADGDVVAYFDDQNGDGIINGSDRVWIYFGLRRGGKSYYALDVTNKNSPQFKFKISNETGTGKVCLGTSTCSTVSQYSQLGQTWSTPVIGKVRALLGAANNPPAVIVGGGYDTAEDSVPPAARTVGRSVYVINGDTGAVVGSWGIGQSGTYLTGGAISTYSIPSEVAAINSDFDAQNLFDRLVVGDMGGNVWRFDIDDATPSNWRGLQLASLSNAVGEKRKFFFPPAIALQNGTGYSFHAVYLGSGDKEHPLLTQSTTPATTDDRMFMLMDDPSLNSGGGTPTGAGPSALPTPVTLGTLYDIANSSSSGVAASSLVGMQGWFRRLDVGEKVINSAAVFVNFLQNNRRSLRFGTYAPTAQLNACTPPGEGRLNEIDSLTGDLFQINGTALPPSRFYADFKGHGYVSSSTSLLLQSGSGSKTSYEGAFIGPTGKLTPTGTVGVPSKIYWYLEPEQ